MNSIRLSLLIASCIALLSPSNSARAQQLIVVKDTFSDLSVWNVETVLPGDAASLVSPTMASDFEFRFYFGFVGKSGVLESVTFPVAFFDGNSPVNNPSGFSLSIHLFEGLDELVENPLSIVAELQQPANPDWQNNIIANISGYDIFQQSWDLSDFDFQLFEGQQYYLAATAIGGSFADGPLIPGATGNGNTIGDSDDYFTLESSTFFPPVPVNNIYPFCQTAVRLTAISNKVLLGDINCDGTVNLLDVAPFVDLIASGEFSPKGDFDSDGAVNLLDVAPFVNAIVGG